MHSLDCHTEVFACAFFQAFFPFCHGEFVKRTFLVFQRGEFIFDLKTLVHMSGSEFRWKINKLVYPFSLIFSCRSTEASSKRRYSGTSRFYNIFIEFCFCLQLLSTVSIGLNSCTPVSSTCTCTPSTPTNLQTSDRQYHGTSIRYTYPTIL